MGKIVTMFCDRCKKELRYDPLFVPLTRVRMMKRTRMRIVFQKPDFGGWNDTCDVELCKECVKELEKWMEGKPEVTT